MIIWENREEKEEVVVHLCVSVYNQPLRLPGIKCKFQMNLIVN